MNLHLLKIFAAVVECGSFSRAAEQLGVSQPAVSKAVRELEAQLDTVLLDRGGRSLKPSEPGQVLFDYAQGIVAMERAALEAVQAFYDLQRGSLVIGASTTVAAYWLPSYIAAFAARHPQVRLRLVCGNTHSIAEQLLDCRVDVAVVEGPVDDARIETLPWREDEMLVVVAPDSPLAQLPRVAPEALAQCLWVEREPGSGSREVMERWLAQLGVVPARWLEAGSTEAVVQTVAAGLGVAMVPKVAVAESLALGRLVALALDAPPLTRRLTRLRLPRRPTSQAALAFEAMLTAPGALAHGAPDCSRPAPA